MTKKTIKLECFYCKINFILSIGSETVEKVITCKNCKNEIYFNLIDAEEIIRCNRSAKKDTVVLTRKVNNEY